jgi:hypothetical protein
MVILLITTRNYNIKKPVELLFPYRNISRKRTVVLLDDEYKLTKFKALGRRAALAYPLDGPSPPTGYARARVIHSVSPRASLKGWS